MKIKKKYKPTTEISARAVGYWNSAGRECPSEILGLILAGENDARNIGYLSVLDDELQHLPSMKQFKVTITVEAL